MKEYLNRVIDRHSARIGSDFEERLDKSKLAFRWEMLQRIEATMEGISQAIEKGLDLKTKSEKEIKDQKILLTKNSLPKMGEVKDKLIDIRAKDNLFSLGGIPNAY